VPLDADRWPATLRGRTRLAAAFAERRREALHARDLLVLRDDAPVRDDLQDLAWRGADRIAVEELAVVLDEPAAADRVVRWAEAAN
jgi:hypothetical protein